MKELYQKIALKFSSQKKSTDFHEREGIRPLRHWKILLSFLSFALIAGGCAAFYFYMAVDKGILFETESHVAEPVVSLNTPLLQETVSQIKMREESLKNIKQAPPDPSF